MEILKFDESGSASPSRKRSGRGAILVTFVALVFGAGTALASGTLAINSNAGIELAQGVAQTVQCDPNGVNISMNSSLSTDASKFFLAGITVSKIHDGCIGKNIRLKVYNDSGTQQTFCSVSSLDTGCSTDSTGTYVQGTVPDGSPNDENVLEFTFSKTLEIVSAATVKNVTIETIS
jgi:hypothetical protein